MNANNTLSAFYRSPAKKMQANCLKPWKSNLCEALESFLIWQLLCQGGQVKRRLTERWSSLNLQRPGWNGQLQPLRAAPSRCDKAEPTKNGGQCDTRGESVLLCSCRLDSKWDDPSVSQKTVFLPKCRLLGTKTRSCWCQVMHFWFQRGERAEFQWATKSDPEFVSLVEAAGGGTPAEVKRKHLSNFM